MLEQVRNILRKANPQLEVRLGRDLKGNKSFYQFITSKRLTKDLVTDKTEVLNALFA